MPIKYLGLKALDDKQEVKKRGFFSSEKSFKGFYRKLSLPVPVKSAGVKSHFSKGVLETTMPKLKKAGKG